MVRDVERVIKLMKSWGENEDEAFDEIRRRLGTKTRLVIEEDSETGTGCGSIELHLLSLDRVIHANFTSRCDKLRAFTRVWLEALKLAQTVQVGDVVEVETVGGKKERYIIAHPKAGMVCAIHLGTGNRWRDPVKVKDIHAITNEEAKRIIDETFVVVGKAKEVLK